MSEQFTNQTMYERADFLQKALDSIIHEKGCINDQLGTVDTKRSAELDNEWDALFKEYSALQAVLMGDVN